MNDEIVDECDNCGQELEYRGTRVGHESWCEYCYEMAMELAG